MNLPQPLHEQTVCLEFVGFPVPQEEGMLIIMRTPDPKGFYREHLRGARERVNMKIGCFYVQYISQKLTKVVFASDTDSFLVSFT